jgi:hypothetical protein
MISIGRDGEQPTGLPISSIPGSAIYLVLWSITTISDALTPVAGFLVHHYAVVQWNNT